jgi:hypothetical protein
MRKTVAWMLLAAVAASGCTGTFQLTRKVYNFHRSQTDKWMDEVVFLVVVLVPVYSIATLADAVIFNSIEFWTGNNPVTDGAAGSGHVRIVQAGDATRQMAFDPASGQITVSNGGQPEFVLAREQGTVAAKDAEGRLLFRSIATADGGVAVYDRQARLVKSYSAEDVRAFAERAARN